jgi:hypothetical protein
MRAAWILASHVATLHAAGANAFTINPCGPFGQLLSFSPAHPGPNEPVGFRAG